MTLGYYVFNKVFAVNHWRDILNCSYKWLCYSARAKNHYFCFPLNRLRITLKLFTDYIFEQNEPDSRWAKATEERV